MFLNQYDMYNGEKKLNIEKQASLKINGNSNFTIK